MYFSPMFYIYTSLKVQKTKGFPGFSGGIEMKDWTKMSKTYFMPPSYVLDNIEENGNFGTTLANGKKVEPISTDKGIKG